MQHSEAVANQIRTRIAELQTEIGAHERALAALEGPKPRNASSKPRAAGPPSATPRSRSRRRAAASAEAVLDALNDGTDEAAVIAKQFGVSVAVVRNRLQQLEQAGRVSRTGNRRSTRWHQHAA